ncbi:MAG: HemK2/MTQ2 family protein methyltransferase [Candidatus Methanoperedens sp.]|nr:class I SAM-dependent methyltransferase [Candidatus Methanoperedens sp.]MCZ7396266.1 class I SAM-dependent methyltransferase [Candidatus Methanoperedens sp.]
MEFRYKNTVIKTTPLVYEPSEDSFLLAEVALSEIKDKERILELGCGSGIISAVIKANTKARIAGIDINPFAAACTKQNGVEAIRGDLLSCIKGKFDMIIFNPPYLPGREGTRKDWIDIALDGGYDGREIIYRFLEDALPHLVENGRVLMVVSSLTGIGEVKSKMKSLNYEVEDKLQERFMFEQLAVIAGTRR